jgi:excisionase family DNA binding protein
VKLTIGGQPFVIAGEAVRAELDEKLIEEIEEAVLVSLVSAQARDLGSPYFSVQEAADYLRTTPQAIYDRLSAGKLKRVKDGRRTLIERAEIERLLSR